MYYFFDRVEEPPDVFHYVLCPNTTFVIGDVLDTESVGGGSPIIPGLANSFITCGEDGNADNNCTLTGGDFHFYFPDFIIAKEIYMIGITFEESKAASVYGDAHPSSHIYFLDCHWKNNVGRAAVYIHYTPGELRRHRMLKERESYNLEDVYEDMVEDVEALYNRDHKRELQHFVKYSMSCVFAECSFEENHNELATIFNLGGGAELINSTFVNNNATELAVFTNVGNAHAFIHEDTSFINNYGRLGPVFIDQFSFLQLSRDNTGDANTGGQCDGIFFEDENSVCFDTEMQCTGNCCEFGDESCDLFLEV